MSGCQAEGGGRQTAKKPKVFFPSELPCKSLRMTRTTEDCEEVQRIFLSCGGGGVGGNNEGLMTSAGRGWKCPPPGHHGVLITQIRLKVPELAEDGKKV